MATSEEIEKYCRNCVSRDFVNGKGLVCKRTGELPAFEEECDSFEQDKELERLAPPKPEDFPVSMTEEEMLAEENLSKGVLCAVVACIVGAVAWGLISVSTGRQIGFMPIAIGFMVGFAMRQGKGIRPIFGIIGAALSLVSCILGDFFVYYRIYLSRLRYGLFSSPGRCRLWRDILYSVEKCNVDDCPILRIRSL